MADGRSPLMRRAISPGTRLNGIYEIEEQIAAGGMGEIYRARSIQTGDPVAIKLMLPEFAEDSSILALFRKEASALHSLHHEAIVRYFLFSVEPNLKRPYLATEFVDGQTLSDLLGRGPMVFEAVVTLMRRVASGLQAAHERGIIHRDVSPDNIIIPRGSDVARAKIIDFGIARSTQAGAKTVIGGGFAGKFNYVSPEQLGLFGGDVTAKSDIYSLGLLLVEALTGKPIDMGGSQVQVLEKRRKVPDLGAIDLRIRPLIDRMLQPDPADRPDSMEAVAKWALGGAQGLMRRRDADAASGRKRKEEPEKDPDAEAEKVPYPRWMWIAGGVAAAVLLAGIGGGVFYILQGPADPLGAQRPQSAGLGVQPAGPPARPTVSTAAPVATAPAAATPPPGSSLPQLSAAPPLAASPPPPPPPGLPSLSATPPPSLSAPAPAPSASLPAARPPAAAAPAGRPSVAALPPAPSLAPSAPSLAPAAPSLTPAAPTLTPAAPTLTPAAPTLTPAAPTLTPAAPALAPAAPPAAVSLPPADVVPTYSPPPLAAAPQAASPPPALNSPAPPPAAYGSTPTLSPAYGPSAPPSATAMLPPQSAPAPSAQERVQRVGEFISQYDGGECFFIMPLMVAANAAQIEGYGASVTPFQSLDDAFKRANGFEADIGVRQVTQGQCPAVTFLHRLKQFGGPAPKLNVSEANIRSGEILRGTVAPVAGRHTALLLVTDEGAVHSVTALLKPGQGGSAFSLGLQRAGGPGAKPQLLIALSSVKPLDTIREARGSPSDQLFPFLLAEAVASGQSTGAVARLLQAGLTSDGGKKIAAA